MESFEELGLSPDLVEVLAAEGIEQPVSSQEALVPLVARGGNVLGMLGPGSGAFTGVMAGLLDRLLIGEDEEDDPGVAARILILTPTAKWADAVARSVATYGHPLGLRVSALGTRWALPELSQIVVADIKTLHEHLRRSRVKLERVTALVVVEARTLLASGAKQDLEAVLESVPGAAQRIVLSSGPSPELRPFVDRYARKAVEFPSPEAVEQKRASHSGSPGRELTFTMARPKAPSVLSTVDLWLSDDLRHVVVYSRTEDAAADIGDYLTLHGFVAGAPGDDACPVWIATEPYEPDEDRSAIGAVSLDVPSDPEALAALHGKGYERSHVVLDPTERDHLRTIAPQAGFRARPVRPVLPDAIRNEIDALRSRLEAALQEGGLSPHYLVLEPLLEEWDATEVAAAALSLVAEPAPSESAAPSAPSAPANRDEWAKIFISVGERDGAGVRDLLGAITGETGVAGSDVGKIDVRDTFSIVEVRPNVAKKVIRGLNGTTVRGRSARVDFHRPRSPGDRSRSAAETRRRSSRSDS